VERNISELLYAHHPVSWLVIFEYINQNSQNLIFVNR